MNNNQPLVTVIIIFKDAGNFICEAIESVLSQSYKHWELLLIDDGSTDESTQIALSYVEKHPNSIRYFDHPNHTNLGMSASRNLGIRSAQGDYIAFLDADDIWLPNKLDYQVNILESHPAAGMVYGNTLYWYSWTGQPEDKQRDHIPLLGVEPNAVFEPPDLLQHYLEGKAAVPCTCSIMVRREVLERIGGFEDSFRGMYEDQVFYAKISLAESIFVADACLDQYRQHPQSISKLTSDAGQSQSTRMAFLTWLDSYLLEHDIKNRDIWLTLKRELWLNGQSRRMPFSQNTAHLLRWMKKWTLRLEAWLLPLSVRRWLWLRGHHV